ncbi:MAG: response regulator, partial [Planctomycetota bacterium]
MGNPGERETRGGLLLVEDNEADILFFRRALSKVREGVPLDVVTNGVAAVQALSAEGSQKLPSIVLLDLKLPRMSGL